MQSQPWWRYIKSSYLLANLILVLFSGTVAGAEDDWVWAAHHPVGSYLPVFSANDYTGKRQSLTGLLGNKGTLMFFNRSTDW